MFIIPLNSATNYRSVAYFFRGQEFNDNSLN